MPGLARFRVLDFKRGTWRVIEFPEKAYAAFNGVAPEFDTQTFRVNYQSMVTPPASMTTIWNP